MKIGSLCTGYGGLDMAVASVLGGETVWTSDIDKGACKIIAHRYPGVPNLGDFTATDWSTVKPVDVLTAGFPCQPVSHAGKRLGDDDERWLWDDVARAVGELGPRLVVLENVRGLLTAGGGRLFGRVLGTLADLGYDAQWHGLRAADVGAPHGRFRVFIVAYPQGDAGRIQHRDGTALADTERGRRDGRTPLARRGQIERAATQGPGEGARLLPSPRTSDTNGAGRHGDGGLDLRTAVSLLPTPAVNDMGEGKTVEAWDAWTDAMKAKHGNGNGHGASLSIEAQRLTEADPVERYFERVESLTPDPVLQARIDKHRNLQWGQYAAAIHRWETLTRPAPPPTELSAKGTPRLSARFSEWMMGLPDGWITDVPGITRNEALKAAGNGVVPQQAAAALRIMLGASEVAA